MVIFREAGKKDSISVTLTELGMLAHRQREYLRARTLFTQALGLQRELGNQASLAATLQAIADLEATQERPLQAMRLWGAAESLREILGTALKPGECVKHEQQVASARAALGEDAANSAWNEGRAMNIDDVCAQAVR